MAQSTVHVLDRCGPGAGGNLLDKVNSASVVLRGINDNESVINKSVINESVINESSVINEREEFNTSSTSGCSSSQSCDLNVSSSSSEHIDELVALLKQVKLDVTPEVSEDSYCSDITDDCPNESSDFSDDEKGNLLVPCRFKRQGLLSIIIEENEPEYSMVDDGSSSPHRQALETRQSPDHENAEALSSLARTIRMEMMEIVTEVRLLRGKLMTKLEEYRVAKEAMEKEYANFCPFTNRERAQMKTSGSSPLTGDLPESYHSQDSTNVSDVAGLLFMGDDIMQTPIRQDQSQAFSTPGLEPPMNPMVGKTSSEP